MTDIVRLEVVIDDDRVGWCERSPQVKVIVLDHRGMLVVGWGFRWSLSEQVRSRSRSRSTLSVRVS